MIETAKRLLTNNMGLRPGESLLVVYDETTLRVGEAFFEAGRQVGAKAMALRIPLLAKNGEEPFSVVARAMAESDVVVAPTGASLTHTQAKKNACKAGARVATMPRITEDMFFNGPITADYNKVAELTKKITAFLDMAKTAELRSRGYVLKMSLEGRAGIVSSGVYRNKGESGNLPSGEAYIAPVEGSAEGVVAIDGSFAGLGVLQSPLKLTFEKGKLTKVEGADAERLEAMLGDNPMARNLAELGIGTNDKARVTGVILEDEKIYGTVHIALGSNDTFGGAVAAGIHVDGIITKPELLLDGKLVTQNGVVFP
ncbi:MAG: aminopeptidase [Synergistaceae bacterium]|jgi:leucyl aminopeptidase (aminopeptidase T)|nr:aminopeptidase [Synergistaceae bacterium]